MVKPGVVDLFYKGYINAEEHYAKVKEHKVYFGPEANNALYGLEDNEIGHVTFKNPKEHNLQEAFEKVTWAGIR